MPSIIAISETKLRKNNVYNISIPGYEFISKASKTNAGGVGLYKTDDIQFIKRPDLEINLIPEREVCFFLVKPVLMYTLVRKKLLFMP